MKKGILSLIIAIALIVAVPKKASALYTYSVTSEELITPIPYGPHSGPYYVTVVTVYSMDIFNQITVVSRTVVHSPNVH